MGGGEAWRVTPGTHPGGTPARRKAPDGSLTWISGHFETVRPHEELDYTWKVSTLPGATLIPC